MTTLSLETSKKVFEIVGDYETEKKYAISKVDEVFSHAISPRKIVLDPRFCWTVDSHGDALYNPEDFYFIPRPNFAEVIRVLPKIGVKKGWGKSRGHQLPKHCQVIAKLYMRPESEPEGMAAVEKYLLPLL